MKVNTLSKKQHSYSRKIMKTGLFALLFSLAATNSSIFNGVRMDLTKQINLLNENDVIADEKEIQIQSDLDIIDFASLRRIQAHEIHKSHLELRRKAYHENQKYLEKNEQALLESKLDKEDKKDNLELQVEMINRADAQYSGLLYLGTPVSQPINVVFDTGSEFLAVTSSFCSDESNNEYSYLSENADGDLVEYHDPKSRCNTEAYNFQKSETSREISDSSSKITYGSAKIQGFYWKDYTCMHPIKTEIAVRGENGLLAELDNAECTYFDFVALYRTRGIKSAIDGILGLSPKKKGWGKDRFHYLSQIKKNGLLDNSIVSFSLAHKQNSEIKSYALFGGYNSTQIVGGAQGLKTFKNHKNILGTWCLRGEGMWYGKKPLFSKPDDFPAIIDTGSSQISIPPKVYAKLVSEWEKTFLDITCTKKRGYCSVPGTCKNIENKVKNVGFQMNGFVFEIAPQSFLVQDNYSCVFLIHKTALGGGLDDLYLIGDVFLRSYYSVYDFDHDTVGLGMDIHAEGKISIFKGL